MLGALLNCIHPYTAPDGAVYRCGQCPKCLRSRSTEWAIRGRHEYLTQKKACFITLTYDKEHLVKGAIRPENRYDKRGILVQEHVQKYLKRLRKHYNYKKLRYIYCGEYGTLKWRPHYHLIIYGLDHTDDIPAKLWPYGYTFIDRKPITDNVIQYVMGYVRKKFSKWEQKDYHYKDNNRPEPYMRCSQGIGRDWAKENVNSWSESMEIKYRGFTYGVPRYYSKLIYKEEGRTFKYFTYESDYKGNTTKKTTYKTIKNIDGELTKKIISKSEESTIYNTNKLLDHINIEEIDKEIITYETIKLLAKRNHDYKIQWKEYKNMKQDDFEKIYNRYKYKGIHKKEEYAKQMYSTNLNDITEMYLNNIAKQKNDSILKGIYGRRDKYELLEELTGTNNL